MIRIKQNFTVRTLDIEVDAATRDRYIELTQQYIQQDRYIRGHRVGPKVDGEMRVVKGVYHLVFDIEEAFADEFLAKLAEVGGEPVEAAQ